MSPRKAGDIGHITRLVSDDVIDSQPACAQAVFALLFTTLRRLAVPGSPCYRVCLSILDTISQVRSDAVAGARKMRSSLRLWLIRRHVRRSSVAC
jgi:hypothetical protein